MSDQPSPAGGDAPRVPDPSETLIVPGPNSTSALQDQLADATKGEYRIERVLGRGGMATVFLAHDLALDRKVAIKVMSPELFAAGDQLIDRFMREARTGARLNHPHIIPVYAIRQSAKLVFFVMKYIEGKALDDVIKAHGQLPISLVCRILAQAADALAYGHRNGIVHRDVKPGNMMLDKEGWVIVTDLGIAKVQEAQGLTATGSAIGTPTYMSPEQSSGARDITGAADQYSLGCVAFEMLTGAPPFTADTVVALIFKHYTEEPPSLSKLRPDCPPEVVSAVAKMLQKAPEDRFASLDEAAQVFRDASGGDEESLRLLLRAFATGDAAADEAVRRRTPSPTATVARATEVRRGAPPVSREVAEATTASSGAPTSSLPPLGAANKGVATKAVGSTDGWPRTMIPAQPAKPRRASRWRAPGVFTVLMAALAAVVFVFPRVGGLASAMPEETAIQAQRRAVAEAAVQRGEAPGADGDCTGIRADLPTCRAYRFVSLADIAPVMIDATLAAQDPTFQERSAVDWSLMRQAAGYPRAAFSWGNAADREDLLSAMGALPTRMATVGAAGSLTQQLVQQVYFPVSDGMFRKLREIATADRVASTLSRDRILELYLNSADFGPGLYGVEAAAQAYFKASAAKLTRSQAATLAAILIAPRASNPNYEPARMRERQALILRRLGGEQVRVPLPGLTVETP